ncbi:MAG: DUF2871 domain-containing protein [Slackia sp.]|nr:DUF2871 domain-containing protein [Slackia sp.]
MKKYMNCAIVYAVLALAGGVFFREFTKLNGFDGATALGTIHPHYLILGTLFFLALTIFSRVFSGEKKGLDKVLIGYQVGLNAAVVMMLVRGVFEVLRTALPSGADAAIAGIAGLSHIVLGVCLVWTLVILKRAVAAAEQA